MAKMTRAKHPDNIPPRIDNRRLAKNHLHYYRVKQIEEHPRASSPILFERRYLDVCGNIRRKPIKFWLSDSAYAELICANLGDSYLSNTDCILCGRSGAPIVKGAKWGGHLKCFEFLKDWQAIWDDDMYASTYQRPRKWTVIKQKNLQMKLTDILVATWWQTCFDMETDYKYRKIRVKKGLDLFTPLEDLQIHNEYEDHDSLREMDFKKHGWKYQGQADDDDDDIEMQKYIVECENYPGSQSSQGM